MFPGQGTDVGNRIDHIWFLNRLLTEKFMDQLQINTDLNRRLVSFQGNKLVNGHRWYNYREGFSSELVRYCIEQLGISGPVLDPFAGSGTTLFTASRLGIDSIGIELLPNSICNMEFRKLVQLSGTYKWLSEVKRFVNNQSWEQKGPTIPVNELRITGGAYPQDTKTKLERFLHELSMIEDFRVKQTLLFSVMCILEKISYTRKDGQYLRWDARSNRQAGKKPFSKGKIYSFEEALDSKVNEIIEDIEHEHILIENQAKRNTLGNIELLTGSCLDIIPTIHSDSINAVVTSPPYCNRYDYTRTYALELAFLGVSEDYLKTLRQSMLSCTVENKEKYGMSAVFPGESFVRGSNVYDNQELVQEIVRYLDDSRVLKH